MTRTKSSRALLSVVLAVLMAAAFMPSLTYSSFAATAKKATKVTKLNHTGAKVYGKVGSKYTLKYKLSPSKLTSSAQKTVWKSSNSSVVKVIATKGKHATVKVKSVGTAKITVYTKANTKAKAVWSFKTKEDKTTLTGVTVSAPNAKDPATELKVGTTLQAKAAPAEAKDVTYQWYADGTKIDGATSSEFAVTTDQIGKAITVKAASKNEVESAATAKVSDVTVGKYAVQKLTDTTSKTWGNASSVNVGDSLRFVASSKSSADLTKDTVDDDVTSIAATYQWYRVGGQDVKGNSVATAISGATSSTYTVTKEDAGYTLQLVVTPKTGIKGISTDANGKTKTYSLGSVTTSSVSVALKVGTDNATDKNAFVGTALTASVTPVAAANDVTYQWYAGSNKIDGATSATYTPTVAGSYSVKISLKQGESTWVLGTDESSVNVNNKANKQVAITNAWNTNAYDSETGVTRSSNQIGDTLKVTANDSAATVQWFLKGITDNKTGKDTVLGTGATLKVPETVSVNKKNVSTVGKSVYAVVTGGSSDYLGTTATSNDFQISATSSKLTNITVVIDNNEVLHGVTPDANNSVTVPSGKKINNSGSTVVIRVAPIDSNAKITTDATGATVDGKTITIKNVTTNNNITFTVDLDGDGDAYTPTTYTVNMSNVARA